METVWDGIIRSEILSDENARIRQALAHAARGYDWPRVLIAVEDHKELVNTTRPGGTSLYAPLHQAAHGGAPAELVVKLIGLDADGVEAKLVTESWCRVVEGSGQRHEITSAGSKLVAEHFV